MELKIAGVTKTYKNGVKALKGVDLTVGPGMFGLLGPNGAGKSTLMRILATLQEADAGVVSFGDVDVLADKDQVRQVLGYLPQEFGLYPNISAERLLDHLALLKGITGRGSRARVVDELLQLTNLADQRKQQLGSFSGGMKQRFGIAQALLGKPELLIVDEPTAGLDPEERVRFHNLLNEIGEVTVVILSTHIVSDVSNICTDMAIINEGEVLLHRRPADAITALEGKIWEKTVAKEELDSGDTGYGTDYELISSRQLTGKVTLRVFCETTPGNGFSKVIPDLHDVYFHAINLSAGGNGCEP
jgi:ABC-type multidrug transport system ATPase subunit